MQTPRRPAALLAPIGTSYYVSASSLSPAFYLALLDRGWRRSGTLLYKPDQRNSCCPQYTIRLDATAFHASKDQRQALNRFNKHVLGEGYIKEAARRYPRSREQAKKRETDFDLVERVHEGEKEHVPSPPEPAHDFSVTLEPSGFTEEKYALYENYQRVVHRDPPSRISRDGFKRFLCVSPLKRSTQTVDGKEAKLGSYHQCYRLDGKLVAVGVLDLLPHCVSAVYFMYDESVATHNPGKLGALREIALAREDGYRWWYAGFYIHSCTKMRYKGDYSPQFILDPETYAWNPLDADMRRRLDENEHLELKSSPKRTPVEEMDGADDDDEEEEDDANGAHDDTPIFARSMPGLLTRAQLLNEVDLDHVAIRVHGRDHETSDLVSWEASSIDSTHAIKGAIAELASAVGPELAREMVVDFR